MTLTNAPRIDTERLVLRGPEARDFEPVAAFFADGDRSWGFGGPQNRPGAWRWTPAQTAIEMDDLYAQWANPANARSHRLCERMGAVIDGLAQYPTPVRIYRHFATGAFA